MEHQPKTIADTFKPGLHLNVPCQWPGTDTERAANHASHNPDWESGRCMNCDSRISGTTWDWPCGADVPREWI